MTKNIDQILYTDIGEERSIQYTMGGVMEGEDPISAVQIRLAKGEITPSQYREIITHLLKNITSFEQATLLKTIQIRYAKSEISVDEYKEIYHNILEKLNSHPWSPPLHILHVRYAQGEINYAQYDTMFDNLIQKQCEYDKSTPLWFLNIRYATGELITAEYEEILSLFTVFTQSLQQESRTPANVAGIISHITEEFDPKPLRIISSEDDTHLASSTVFSNEKEVDSDTCEIDTEPDNTLPVEAEVDSDKFSSESKVNELSLLPDSLDHPEEKHVYERFLPQENQNFQNPELMSLREFDKDSINLIIQQSTEKNIKIESPQTEFGSPISKPLVQIPEFPYEPPFIADVRAIIPSNIYPPPIKTSGSSLHHLEALPVGLSYSGEKNVMGIVSEESGVQFSPDMKVRYSMAPVSSPVGKESSYKTVTSRISQPVLQSNWKITEPDSTELPTNRDNLSDNTNIRMKVKTLIAKGDYDEVLNMVNEMIVKNKDDYRPYFYRGMVQYYLNLYSNALEDLDRAKTLCHNNSELRKINTIRSRILAKQKELIKTIPKINKDTISSDTMVPTILDESVPEIKSEELSDILNKLGKKAQELINNEKYPEADRILNQFIDHCKDLSLERQQAESLDEIYAASGYVRYQRKEYVLAKEYFLKALGVNAHNTVANTYMKDILIRAVRKR